MRRDSNARPAITKLSGMENLRRILDLPRPADKSQSGSAEGAGLVIAQIPARPKSLMDLNAQQSDQCGRGRRSQLKSTPIPKEELLRCKGTLRLKSSSRSREPT